MRLDHLLSKEFCLCPQLWVVVDVAVCAAATVLFFYRVVMHLCVVWVRLGWLCLCCAVGVHLRGVGGLNHLRDGSMLVRCWVSGAALVCPWALLFTGVHCCVFRWWGGVVLCENCIVDASIFLFCVLVFVP